MKIATDSVTSISDSDLVRQHASEAHISVARRGGARIFAINVGAVHKALALSNRVPLVCAALGSKKFLTENHLRLVSKTGPPSGQSTTVTYTYEFIDGEEKNSTAADSFLALRGIAKDVFAALGGGEACLRKERAEFYNRDRRKSPPRR